MNRDNFNRLGIIEPIHRALSAENISDPTPVQLEAIPLVLEGHDVIGRAQTGSGKTAAYALPMLQNLLKTRTSPVRGSTRALVLVPTRELAEQVAGCFSSFGRYLGLKVAAVYGGVSRKTQITVLARGIDILVATPGRLLDLMEDRKILLGRAEIVVLDEADRMLGMGFIPDIKRIAATLPASRQTLLFSATLPSVIMDLAAEFLQQPRHVEISSSTREDPQITQKVLFVNRDKKNALLMRLLADREISRVLVFTRTKYRANNLSRQLSQKHVKTDALHSDKTQEARRKALQGFHAGHIRVLVATDIAARGIDVDDIDHVINYELPIEPELYIHRIGRTARAGKQGTALSFCDASELKYLRQIEKVLKKQLPVLKEQPFHSPGAEAAGKSSALKQNPERVPVGRPSMGKQRQGTMAIDKHARGGSPAGKQPGGNRKPGMPKQLQESRVRNWKSSKQGKKPRHSRAGNGESKPCFF
jgi:ATP-dependent RNA helicase RhlE